MGSTVPSTSKNDTYRVLAMMFLISLGLQSPLIRLTITWNLIEVGEGCVS
jgi:hypothetical protein